MFAGPLEVLDGSESDEEIPADARVTAPKELPEQLQFAYDGLNKAISHLLRGNYKASVQFAADALNDIAIQQDIHGYASY